MRRDDEKHRPEKRTHIGEGDALIDPKNGTYYSAGQGLAPAKTVAVHCGGNAVPPERRTYTDPKTKQ